MSKRSAKAPNVDSTMAALLCAVCVVLGCSSPDEPTQDVGVVVDAPVDDMAVIDMATTPDMKDTDAGSDAGVSPLDPREYCEVAVDVFCPYYLRCGRIAATDAADCERNFLETCNAAYEPQYAALADTGRLVLSAAGIEACGQHLETVACERQVFDLDGPCADVWLGQGAVDDPCAPGIGSFVCGTGTECVLDLSLCGACQPAGAAGEPCVDNRCQSGSTCIADVCELRGLPGDACDDERLCAVGTGCDAGTCAGTNIVGVGDACDATNRCPYQSSCRSDVCVQDALNGESCADANCASGWCDGTICRAFITPGDPCAERFQCLSGQCEGGVCGPPLSSCFSL